MSREYPCVYYENEKCTLHGSDPEHIDWCVMGPCSHETPSNADHIRAMSDEELASVIMCPYDVEPDLCYSRKSCYACSLDWLKLPYKEDT